MVNLIGFDKLSWEINSRNSPWIKNLALLAHIFRRLFKNLTRKKCVLISEFKTVKHRMCKIWST